MSTPFAQAADKELWEALNHKSVLLANPAGAEDKLVIAQTVLNQFLGRLGALLDAEPTAAVPCLLKSIASKVENALLGPVQCDLVDNYANRAARKAMNTSIGSIVEHMGDGTMLITRRQMENAVISVCVSVKSKVHSNPFGVLTQAKETLLLVVTAVPLVPLRRDLWAQAGLPKVVELVEYVRVVVIDKVSNSRERRELATFAESLLTIPDEVAHEVGPLSPAPAGHIPTWSTPPRPY